MGKMKNPEVGHLDSLPWRNNLDDSVSFVGGSEGGFLSLEEIDESEYNLGITDPLSGKPNRKKSTKVKKRKREETDDGGDSNEVDIADEGKVGEEDKGVKKKKNQKKKKKQKQKRKKAKDVIDNHVQDVGVVQVEDDEEQVDEAEYNAWNDLRLHPLLSKSIHRLGFKEPTPIQKACIPAAAHHGKDVIGAAETGSGKTLAFGLPILQRFLEEQEKATRLFSEDGEAVERIAPRHLLRALIVTPTRELALQVTDHLKEAATFTNFRVVSIVGGMSTQKQERLLKARPEVIVGTPGRLWELMSGGESHLVELHSLSFFVLDEADRMIENGHFRELHSIIDMLPMTSDPNEALSQDSQNCTTVSNLSRKKRQTLVFSATIALSSDFRKKLKRGYLKTKPSISDDLTSIESLSERAGMRADAAIIDLTNASIMVHKLVESFLECREDDKDAYLYYLLHVHGQGRTIVFCTSVAALRHVSSLCRILGVSVCTLHSQMQQRARLKAIDRFRKNEHGVLIATDVAARGLDIPGVRTVVHYQLPHSAEVYVHRSGRTARALADGCSVALISPDDRFKFASLCKSFSKETFHRFPVESSYIPEVMKRLSIARQIDKISRRDSKEKATNSWIKRSAESIEMVLEDDDSEEERVNSHKQKKVSSVHLKNLQQELDRLLSRPLQPKTFSHRFLAGAGVSPMLQGQLEELAQRKKMDNGKISGKSKEGNLVVIGHDRVEPLQALMRAGSEVRVNMTELAEKQRNMDSLRKKRKEQKKRQREQRRKEKKKLKGGTD